MRPRLTAQYGPVFEHYALRMQWSMPEATFLLRRLRGGNILLKVRESGAMEGTGNFIGLPLTTYVVRAEGEV